MACGQVSRARWLAVAGLSAFVAVSGCDGCGGEPPVEGNPTMVLSVLGGPTLQADGSSTKTIEIIARDADGNPDNSAITVSVDAGEFISDVGEVDGTTLTATPSDGGLTFEYLCDESETGRFDITAQNGNASAVGSVSCVEQAGQPVLTLDYDTVACSVLPADGQSACEITARVTIIADNGDISPRVDETITANVLSAILTPDANTPADTPAPSLSYLAPMANTAPSQQVTGVTDDNGEFTFYVRSKLDELVTVNLSVSAPALTDAAGNTLSTDALVRTDNFQSQAEVTVTASPQNIVGAAGQSSTIGITVRNPFGTAAAQEDVRVTLPANAGAEVEGPDGTVAPTDGDVLTVTLDDNGQADVTFRPPAVDGDLVEIPVNVTYSPTNLPAVSGSVVVTVLPPDALIVNALAEPDTINSTDNESTTITVSVQQFDNGSLSAVQNASVEFSVQSGDTERIGFGNRVGAITDLPLSITDMTSADGTATATVSTQNDAVRGPAGIDVVVDVGGETVERSVEIIVEREPRLQSIVFVSAQPDAIAVRGSAYPTSSVVSFQVLDDLNQPMANVAVTFNTNATADPSASVVPFGFTDAGGNVSTVLAAGTQAAPISVVARAQFAGIQLVAESEPVPITGGLPSFANSYLLCASAVDVPPFTTECSAVLVDRFTNVAPNGLAVQFRSEGGNITPNVSLNGGVATASFATGPPGPATTSLYNRGLSWSHGLAIPTAAADLVAAAGFAPADCFDNDSTTDCNIIGLCEEPANDIFCPLPLDVDGIDCWDASEAGVLTRDSSQLSAEVLAQPDVAAYVSANGADALIDLAHFDIGEQPADHPSVVYNDESHPGHAALRALVASYTAGLYNCGFPTACLTGLEGGLTWVQGDECNVAAGCMDFAASTRCPNDGLLTVTAIARGEESFTDLNGNGILDYQDSNGNGRHDDAAVEPLLEGGMTPPADPAARLEAFRDIVVDMPEPTLDKNDNCYYDDYDDVERLSTWSKIQIGDLYIDEDGDGLYGYSIEDNQGNVVERRLTNGTWDRDKQLFFQTHMLSLAEGPYFEYGQPCAGPSPGGVPDTQCSVPSANGGQLALCIEYGPGVYLAPDCIPDPDEPVFEGETVDLAYRYVDANGNCWSPGLESFVHTFDSLFLTDLGAEGRTYGLSECGMAGSARSTSQPWCEVAPALGGALVRAPVTPRCFREFISFDRFDTAGLTIHLHSADLSDEDFDFRSDSFAFRVECPYCGDGVVTAPEECDDALDPTGCSNCVAVTPP